MKRKIYLITALLLTLAGQMSAQTSGTCGEGLTWTLENGTLTISGEGAMTVFDEWGGAPWFDGSDIVAIEIGEGVTSIGNCAFAGCGLVETVTLPSTLKTIGYSAFPECKSLTSITIPASVTQIGENMFGGCTALESVEFLAQVDVIASQMFNGCSSLASITIPASVTNIDDWAFYGCSSLTSIDIPASVTTIGESAFGICSSLSEVIFHLDAKGQFNAKYIQPDAFPQGTDLVIYLPAILEGDSEVASLFSGWTVEYYGADAPAENKCGDNLTWAFDESTGTLTISGTGPMWDYEPDEEAMVIPTPWYELLPYVNTIVIGDGVESIGDFAFMYVPPFEGEYPTEEMLATFGCTATSVVIGESVKSIGENSFAYFQQLPFVNIPASVTSIADFAFGMCRSLRYICFDIDDIDAFWEMFETAESAFIECYSLQGFCFLGDLTEDDKNSLLEEFGDMAFFGEIPEEPAENACGRNLTWAFDEDTHTLTISGEGDMWDYPIDYPDWYGYNFSKVIIEEGVTSIGDYAFYETPLTEVTIPATIENIGYGAFESCYSLQYVYFDEGDETSYVMPEIGESVFDGCNSLLAIILPESLEDVLSVDEIWNYFGEYGYCVYFGAMPDADEVIASGDPEETGTPAWTLTFGGTLTIFNDGAMADFDPWDEPYPYWSAYLPQIKNVVIKPEVTFIGNYAFYECENLESVDFAEGSQVTRIGEEAFCDNYNLSSITLPSGLETIEDYAFAGSSISSIYIPASVTSIGMGALADCYQLEAVTVDGGNTVYDSRGNCNAIIETETNTLICGSATTVIPSSVTSIAGEAFEGVGIEEITIPSSVTSIGFYAFAGSSLRSIAIPASVKSIGSYAFYYCNKLRSVTFSEDSQLTSIGSSAFRYCNLSAVALPNDGIELGYNAFDSYVDISYLLELEPFTWTFEDGVLTISGYGRMDNFKSTSSRPEWEEYKEAITSVVIGEDIKNIGNYAFYQYPNLVSVTIADDSALESIGYNAFEECSSLASINIPATVTSIGTYAFYGCSSLASIIIPANVTSIGSYAFYKCSSLASINIPATVTGIGSSAFYGCSSLATITIPANVTSIGSYAFYECSSLTSVTIPAGLTMIDNGVFYRCTSLSNVTFNGSAIKSIGTLAFFQCQLTSITIPASVEEIGESAFSYCEKLETVTFADGSKLKTIGESAFNSCSLLPSITIPSTVESIGKTAFQFDYKLSSVVIEAGSHLSSIGETIFNYLRSNTVTITVNTPYYGVPLEKITNWGQYAVVKIVYVEPEEPDTPINGTCGDDLTWAYEDGVLTIAGTGDMDDYNDGDNAPAWSKRKDYITSIVVNSGVTKIGDYAFARCKNVPTITLPSTLEWIGKNAFMNCTNLETVTLHSLPYFDYYNNDIFGGCSSDLAITLELIDSDYPYYHLYDSSDEMPPFAAISYKRTLANGTVGTIMLPFDPEPIEGVIFRAPEEITTDDVTEATQLVFNKVADDEVWGFKPYLVENNSGNDEIVFTPRQSTGEILYPKNTSDHMDANNTWMQLSSYWHFEGTYELQELDYQNYSVDEEGKPIVDLYYYSTELEKFVYSEGTLIIPPFRAYIKHNSIVEAGDRHDIVIIFSDGDDETTIGGVLTDEGDIDAAEGIYDLSGRRINAPQHGQTYIIRTQSGKAIKYMNK